MTLTQPWTFISNHGLVLSYILYNPRSTAREIAVHIGVTKRTTHKIISALGLEGYIERRRSGRRNVYRVDSNLQRHHTLQDVMVSELLDASFARRVARAGSIDNFRDDHLGFDRMLEQILLETAAHGVFHDTFNFR